MGSDKTCADKAYDYIRDSILTGRYRAGTPLNPNMMARELSCSVVPVREALIRLKSRGVLSQSRRSECYVASLEPREAATIYRAIAAIYSSAMERYITTRSLTLRALPIPEDLSSLGLVACREFFQNVSQSILTRNEYEVVYMLVDRLCLINALIFENPDYMEKLMRGFGDIVVLMSEFDNAAVERYQQLISYLIYEIETEIKRKMV
ncbi:GntR family transcriptional regulator [Martelella mediterranea]|uniref:Regulatory GntR family protein n=1 Tax=Martelella mediterranea TaxID=293089 RepID=A0A4V2V3Z1_9HYPH|nr:GntR family transcriptional regulator [Martelella mediterranea]TCT36173.1 regulatory GntR family protein [Martelella mediterranea]